uniref:Uncharacterized protein n=1 Tax=Nelumbo nucifera TaxID=4432 RepID=A0A822ZBN3_NELNU|nr:TPA_asm: hypothetical protein HUJ06_013270 [Nelumbo nucifera]
MGKSKKRKGRCTRAQMTLETEGSKSPNESDSSNNGKTLETEGSNKPMTEFHVERNSNRCKSNKFDKQNKLSSCVNRENLLLCDGEPKKEFKTSNWTHQITSEIEPKRNQHLENVETGDIGVWNTRG